MIAKSWKQSWTLWVNFAGIALVTTLETLGAVLPTLGGYLPGGVYAGLAIGLAVINALLRAYKTSEPLDTNAITK